MKSSNEHHTEIGPGGTTPLHWLAGALNMNRREMLKVSGFSLGAAALGSATQPSQSDSQTTRKLKIVITGGHPGDPEYGCGGTICEAHRCRARRSAALSERRWMGDGRDRAHRRGEEGVRNPESASCVRQSGQRTRDRGQRALPGVPVHDRRKKTPTPYSTTGPLTIMPIIAELRT